MEALCNPIYKQMLAILGVPRKVLDNMIAFGMIRTYKKSELPPSVNINCIFRMSDINKLLAKLDQAIDPNQDQSQSVSILGLFSFTGRRKLNPSDLFHRIASGKIKPFAKAPERKGIDAYLFSISTITEAFNYSVDYPEFTVTDLNKMLGIHRDTINGWLNSGYLECRTTKPKNEWEKPQRWIGLDQLIKFFAEYIPLHTLAEQQGMLANHVKNRFKKRGIPVYDAQRNGLSTVSRGPLVKSADIVKKLFTYGTEYEMSKLKPKLEQ